MMRWNVVIGGQEISKTGKGLLEYQLVIFHREGLVAAASVIIAPLLLLLVMVRLFPPWADNAVPSPVPDAGGEVLPRVVTEAK
jgi:predicted membrane protein